MAFDKHKPLQQQVKEMRYHIKLLKYHRADCLAKGENPGDRGGRVGNPFVAEESYSVSLCTMQRDTERKKHHNLKNARSRLKNAYSRLENFMNREGSEMHEVQKILLLYVVCIDLYLHIFETC